MSVNQPSSSSQPSNTNQATSGQLGVAPEQAGLVLQRGGEELLLTKLPDRFVVQGVPAVIDRLMQSQAIRATQGIAPAQLTEFVTHPAALDRIMSQVRALPGVNFVSHVYQLQTAPGSSVYITNELTVQFTPEGARQAAAIANALRLSLREPLTGVPDTFIFEVLPLADANPLKIANYLMRQSFVITAEPNVIIRQQPHYRPRDALYPHQWYLQNTGNDRDIAAGSHISIEQAWDITRGSRQIIVAVIDDSFDLNHPDLQGTGKVVAPKDFKDNDLTPLPAQGEVSHGTACAGLAIAEENGIGIVGVAPGCAFMPIRTSGFLDDNTIEQTFDWAVKNGAAVISCSWGPAAVKFNLTLRQKAAITRAATEGRDGKGCVIVFAVGNSNRPINGVINEQGWVNNTFQGPTEWLSGFAAHPDVIAVSACTSLSKKAAYSNWGTQVSICAPSNNAPPTIWLPRMNAIETAPAVRAALRGAGVFTTDQLGAAGYNLSGDYTDDFGGTSSACPLVAGVAALMLSANPNLTAREVRQLLEQTADKIIDSDPDPQLGLRHGTYENGGHSQWFGYGRINAYKAVKAARERLSPVPAPVQPSPPLTADILSSPVTVTGVLIPDNSPDGVVIGQQVTTIGLVKTIAVTVNLNHTYLGDLTISLITPSRRVLLLQGRTLGRQTRLQQTYTPDNAPLLAQAIGQVAQGTWYLWIVDHAVHDTGVLDRWQLALTV